METNHSGIQMVDGQLGSSSSSPHTPLPDDGNRRLRGRSLLAAAFRGDWEAAERILLKDPELIRAPITLNEETALHIVCAAASKEKHIHFAVKLLEKIVIIEDLERGNSHGSTALHFAASARNRKIACLLVEKNRNLLNIANKNNVTPLFLAAVAGHGEVVEDFLRLTNDQLGPHDAARGSKILNMCIQSDIYGVAFQIVERWPMFAEVEDENGMTALDVMAKKCSAFEHQSLWDKLTQKRSCEAFELLEKVWRVVSGPTGYLNNYTSTSAEVLRLLMFEAANNGNYEFLVDLLRRYPDFVFELNGSNYSIFHVAVIHRCEPIFSLIYELGSLKDVIATYVHDNNNILHLAAKLAPTCQRELIPGAALQMQRELLWYKVVEKIVPPTYRKMTNRQGKTPHDVFIEEHASLMKQGEKWMLRTAQYCMVVSTLIATVVFTAAFTLPGGIDGKGNPNFLKRRFFAVFMISEIISMLSASTSTIMFLSILTSRYAEQDFLESLPFWLMTGTTTLFLSLTSMMFAFCTAFLLFNLHGMADISALLGLSISVPLMFILLKYPLWVDIISSVYGSQFLFRSRGRLFSK